MKDKDKKPCVMKDKDKKGCPKNCKKPCCAKKPCPKDCKKPCCAKKDAKCKMADANDANAPAKKIK
jgi:hypothetical protein